MSGQFRSVLLAVIAITSLLISSGAAAASSGGADHAVQRFKFNIPAARLSRTAHGVAAPIGAEIVFSSHDAKVQTHRVKGLMTLPQALDHMLAGTGLSYRCDPKERRIVIRERRGPGEFASFEVRP